MSHNECPQKSSFFVQKFTFHTNDTACNNVFALVLFSTRCRKTRDKSPVFFSFSTFSKHSSIESENKTNDAKDSRIPQDLVNLTVIQKKEEKFFPYYFFLNYSQLHSLIFLLLTLIPALLFKKRKD